MTDLGQADVRGVSTTHYRAVVDMVAMLVLFRFHVTEVLMIQL